MEDPAVTKFHWSVEYRDDEGELCIKHIFGPPSKIASIMDSLIAKGIDATAYRVTPEQADESV